MSERDIIGFLDLADFSVVRTYRFLLFPKYVPLLSAFCNEVLGRLPGIRRLCLMQLIVARPKPQPRSENDVSVSVIIPCRNERDNVEPASAHSGDGQPYRNPFLRRQIHRRHRLRGGTDDSPNTLIATFASLKDPAFARQRMCGRDSARRVVTCS